MISGISVHDLMIPQSILHGIIESIPKDDIGPAEVMDSEGKIVVKPKTRSCQVQPITLNYWFVGMLWFYIQKQNEVAYRYDITTFDKDMIYYIEYNPGDHYTWHSDMTSHNYYYNQNMSSQVFHQIATYTRKLSFSLFLNDDYTGGELQFVTPQRTITVPAKAGKLIIFDSSILHRVRKVKTGQRRVLTGWVIGPYWK